MEEEQVSVIREGRSLAETPTWSVATVTSVLVFVCFVVERSIFRFGRWLKKTRRKALFASLEKIKEELMLLGLISLMLGQWASWISEICVDSSLFNSKFFLCSEQDFDATPTSGKYYLTLSHSSLLNTSFRFESESSAGSSTRNVIPPQGLSSSSQHSYHHQCGMDREPFVSSEGLEQLHRFLFVLGITHVLYSCFAVGLAMTKIYSWRKWESQAASALPPDPQARRNKVMRRQSTFAFHHASHPWSRNRFLIWMLCFLRQFKSSIQKSDYLALRLGFITNHNLPLSYNFHKYMVRSMEDEFHAIVGISWPLWAYAIICILLNIHGNLFLFEMFLLLLPVSSYEVHVLLDTESIFSVAGLNIYFWLSFIPAILVMVVGTKLEHVVSILALEIAEPTGASVRTQVKPRDELFWFGKPEILLRLIQFISFQSAFEMATFLWALWGFKQRSCFMKNHAMVIVRLASGVLVQFWCSYSTVPLSVIITQMGSKCRKALVAESVRESLHSWCKRVKEKSRRSQATRSVCSLDTGTVDERDEITTVASLTLSSCSSDASLNEVAVAEDVNNTAQRNNITTVASRALDQEEDTMAAAGGGCGYEHELSFRLSEYISQSAENTFVQPGDSDEELRIEEESGRRGGNVGPRLYELFQRSDDSDKYI